MNERSAHEKRILYGRRRGHKLRPGRQALVDHLLPHLLLDLEADGGLDLTAAFAAMLGGGAAVDQGNVWLEIGFGGGEHLAAQAEANPEVAFIGCEPFINGIASLLSEVERRGLKNVRLWDDDAREILSRLPDASLSRIFLLFPDPWPKARHAKRRFVSPANLEQVARVLGDGAEFRLASDHPVYQSWALRQLCRRRDFRWTAECREDWLKRPGDWPATRYEQKALKEGRTPHYFRFVRKSRRERS